MDTGGASFPLVVDSPSLHCMWALLRSTDFGCGATPHPAILVEELCELDFQEHFQEL
jgi:hypothetical protein